MKLGRADRAQKIRLRIAEAELAKERAVEADPFAHRRHVERRARERVPAGADARGNAEEGERQPDAVELDREAGGVEEGEKPAVVGDLEREEDVRGRVDHGRVLAR